MDINSLIIGLALIKKHQPDAEWYCSDGSIYCGEYNPLDLTEEERELMEVYGWYESYDDEGQQWCLDGLRTS